jgi:diaminopimelate decarboxylase
VRRPRFIDPFQPAEIRRLVGEFGSPLVILDCERVRVQFRKLRKALPGVDLHYALKPMPHPAVVQTVIEEGGYLDLATSGEVQLVERLGVAPERCAAIEDSHGGIRAAKAAGMRVVAFPNPTYPPDEEALAQADVVVRSLDELTPELVAGESA